MTSPFLPQRRDFLRTTSALAVASFLGRASFAQNVLAPPRVRRRVAIHLQASPGLAQILPGAQTAVYRYTGTLISGDGSELIPVPNSHLGPIIKVSRGQELTVSITNQLGEPHCTHWHGLDVPADMDGHPQYEFASGTTFTHSFPILNRAGSYWYHPHTDMLTAEQVYKGMAGLLLVSDPEEAALALPRGAFDVPLVLQDYAFDAANQFVYTTNSMIGFLGNTILVNGQPNFVLPGATRVYRFRLYNGSQSRIYKLVWDDGTPMVVIGSDGGLLAAPHTYPYVMLAPGERVELWADFRNKPLGSQIRLRSLAFPGAGGTNGTTQIDLATVSINSVQPETLVLPTTLSSITPYDPLSAINASNPRTFAISYDMPTTSFKLNGGSFQMTSVATNEIVRRDTLEIIKITNTTGPVLMAHPIHFHGRQFQVLDRTNATGNAVNYLTVKDGFQNDGWKDTVLLMPGEEIRLLMRYTGYTGLFVYHCHNLVHEDMGMMRNLRIDP